MGRWLRWLALLVVLCVAASAHADEPSETDKNAARMSLEQGDEHFAKKDYKLALDAYRRADKIMGVPTTSIEVGKAAMALGKMVEAYDAYKRAAEYPPKDGEPPAFTTAREQATQKVDEIKPRIPKLRIEVNGAGDADVEVLIDETPIDAWGRTLRVNPGFHEVRAEATGYESASREVVMQEGESRTIVLELVPVGGPNEPVDNQQLWWTMAVVALPVGGASLIAGAVTGGLSLADAAEVKDQCTDDDRCPTAVKDQLERSQTLAHVSTATLVAGGAITALGLVAVVLAVTGDDPDSADEADDADEVDLSIIVGAPGVWLHVTF